MPTNNPTKLRVIDIILFPLFVLAGLLIWWFVVKREISLKETYKIGWKAREYQFNK